jgi:phage antirepressor YoqD-like protein
MANPFKSVTQIAKQYKAAPRTVEKWCQENNVPYVGEGRGKRYLVYPEHEEQFKKRNRQVGRPSKDSGEKTKKDR